jgi:shikimate kinase
MGVGKTTVGKKLAKKLGYYFIDSDQEIEDREHLSIPEIFSQKGEKYFREVESKIISEIIFRDEEIVLSLGGGAFVDEDTRRALKEKTLTIWLDAPIDEILRRVGNKTNRPLLNQKNRREVLQNLALKRFPIYREAELRFEAHKIGHDTLTNKIIKKINEIN